MIKRSPIIKKKCKCGCQKYPSIGCGGYSYSCMPTELKEKVGNKRKLALKNKSKRAILTAKLRAVDKIVNSDNGLELWYIARRYDMTGVCDNCGAATAKYHPKYWKWCCAHIVSKADCPSVATHFYNFAELCYDVCHRQYDSNFEAASKMKCFPEIKRRFGLFKHLIPNEEARKINPFLLDSAHPLQKPNENSNQNDDAENLFNNLREREEIINNIKQQPDNQ